VVIKVLFLVLILSTAALVAVGLAIHFRVKRHLREKDSELPAASEAEPANLADDEAAP
jgi:hypothetical protein